MPTLNWIGKEKVINHHLDVPFRTLVPSYSFGDAETAKDNLIIHGDNLEALKALLPQYEGKIKLIYIDPPYNTGNEGWIYNDNVNDPKIKKWIHEVVGKEGEDLSRHDKWLCMMYPRLKLLHKLLSDDGSIWISIDDNEINSLRIIINDIFGSSNFLAMFPRVTKKSGKSSDIFAKNHDYLLVFSKTKSVELQSVSHNDKGFKYQDAYFAERGYYKLNQTLDYDSLQYSNDLDYPIIHDGKTYYPGTSYENYLERKKGNHKRADWAWRWSPDLFEFGLRNGFVVFKTGRNGTRIYTKTYQNVSIEKRKSEYFIEYQDRTKSLSTLEFTDNQYSNDNATKDLSLLFSDNNFDYSKPLSLLDIILRISTNPDSIILDSFAGSGTTAHAVLKLNQEDGGNRKFIMIEMEDYAETITAERVRRVIKGYGSEGKEVPGTGGGFSYLTLGPSVFTADGALNPEVDDEALRQYIWYAETKTALPAKKLKNKYHLGSALGVSYYFYYVKGEETILDFDFLKTIKDKDEHYVIYADVCSIDYEYLKSRNIAFKKIPRDIPRY